MTPQPGEQRITTHILLNISRIKSNQTMKFGQLIEHPERNIFFKSYAENDAGKLVPDAFFFKKTSYQVKANGLRLISLYFDSPQISIQ